MLSKEYRQLISDIKLLMNKVEHLNDAGKSDSAEDKECLYATSKLFDDLQSAFLEINYLSKEPLEGTLRMCDDGRFELVNTRGKYISHFSCGTSIEIYLYDEYDEHDRWFFGRVEYNHSEDNEGYYFHNRDAGNPYLENGMRARVRSV